MYEVDGLKARELSCTQGVVSQANIDISAPNTGVGSAFNFQIIGAIVVLTILISLFFIKNKNKIPKKVLFGFMMGVVSFGAICAPFNNVASAKSCVKEAGKYDIAVQFFMAKNVTLKYTGIDWARPLSSTNQEFLTNLKEGLAKENIPVYTMDEIAKLPSFDEMIKYEQNVRRVALKVAAKMNMFATIEHTTDKIEPKDTDIRSFNYDLIKTKVIEGAGSTDVDWENAFAYARSALFNEKSIGLGTVQYSDIVNERGEATIRGYDFLPSKESFVVPGEDQARQIYKVYVYDHTSQVVLPGAQGFY